MRSRISKCLSPQVRRPQRDSPPPFCAACPRSCTCSPFPCSLTDGARRSHARALAHQLLLPSGVAALRAAGNGDGTPHTHCSSWSSSLAQRLYVARLLFALFGILEQRRVHHPEEVQRNMDELADSRIKCSIGSTVGRSSATAITMCANCGGTSPPPAGWTVPPPAAPCRWIRSQPCRIANPIASIAASQRDRWQTAVLGQVCRTSER